VAEIFVSYTSKDRDWAFWIGQELEKLGHVAHVDAWEISGGGDIAAWMVERHDKADHILCVISETYLSKPYSSWERRSGQWAAQTDRPNFVLPVRIEDCKLRTLLASVRYCDLFGTDESDARSRLAAFLEPAARPKGPVSFPGSVVVTTTASAAAPVVFPGLISNIPIDVPLHFIGRDKDLAAIEAALTSKNGRAAVTAIHGLRGVGKTVLAAAFAERYSNQYRAKWWIRAETEPTVRADLVGLGVRLGWVAKNAPEEQALQESLDRLRDEGDGVLLIYDNAIGPKELRKFLPRGSRPHVIITSNAPNWGGFASPVEIEVWPTDIGADFLLARTGRKTERDAALALSAVLGGLPLAHEQAAAYCERLGLPLSEYERRFAATPGEYLDDENAAPEHYHDGLTVAKAFALAIAEAAKLHAAAEPLITHAALLAPEPIPLYLFSEGRQEFSEPFASQIEGEGLDEAVAALRAFALVDRESIVDERDSSVTTDCIRLHRLVRQVAAAGQEPTAQVRMRGELIGAMATIYPSGVYNDPAAWLKARRLDAIALALVDNTSAENAVHADILNKLAAYRQGALAAYAEARPYLERALTIREKALGAEHPNTATILNNLGYLLQEQGDLAGARRNYEHALAIREKVLGAEHADTATSLNNLGQFLQAQGDLAGARRYYERALTIQEKVLDVEHPNTATSFNNLGLLLRAQGDLAGARRYHERALAIFEKALGVEHPDTATSLYNLGSLLRAQGELAGARPYYERALAIKEKVIGAEHPDTAFGLNNLGSLLQAQGDFCGSAALSRARARHLREQARARPSEYPDRGGQHGHPPGPTRI
jgi:tetratricopeptide (TPR) repeat protein